MRRWFSTSLPILLAFGFSFGVYLTEESAVGSVDSAAPSPAVENSVREFTRDVARDVTADGPIAWSKYFENTPAFFMAVNGKMAFPSGASAMAGIPDVAKMYKHIDLTWGDDLRVDVLTPALAGIATTYHETLIDAADHRIEANGFFTGIAEFRDGRWQFRNAHWSQPAATAAQ